MTEAIDAGRRIHPGRTPANLLLRQRWESFTGGEIAYAPEPLRIDPTTADYARLRGRQAVWDADLFHVTYRRLG